jgi:hypothetical protein
MAKYIKEFNSVGVCILDVGLLCKVWSKNYSITSWGIGENRQYTFYNGRRIKIRISKEQTEEIIKRLNLLETKDITLNSLKVFHNLEYIDSQLEKMLNKREEILRQYNFVNDVIVSYQNAKLSSE